MNVIVELVTFMNIPDLDSTMESVVLFSFREDNVKLDVMRIPARLANVVIDPFMLVTIVTLVALTLVLVLLYMNDDALSAMPLALNYTGTFLSVSDELKMLYATAAMLPAGVLGAALLVWLTLKSTSVKLTDVFSTTLNIPTYDLLQLPVSKFTT